jgi:hypothetical protein
METLFCLILTHVHISIDTKHAKSHIFDNYLHKIKFSVKLQHLPQILWFFNIHSKNFKNEPIWKLFVAFSMFSMVRNRFRRVSENIYFMFYFDLQAKIWLLNFKKKIVLENGHFHQKPRKAWTYDLYFLKLDE